MTATTAGSPLSHTSPPGLGLRATLNLVLLPLLTIALTVVVWLDYRHEMSAVMEAHGIHAVRTDTGARSTLVNDRTAPEAVARRTLLLHVVAAFLTLLAVMTAINLVLSRLVLRPIDHIRDGIDHLQRGHTLHDLNATGSDEIVRLAEAFSELGLTLDALQLNAIRTDRLATLALLSRHVAERVEPEVRKLGVIAARLHQASDGETRAAAQAVAATAARILASIHGLDRPFEQSGSDSEKRH